MISNTLSKAAAAVGTYSPKKPFSVHFFATVSPRRRAWVSRNACHEVFAMMASFFFPDLGKSLSG